MIETITKDLEKIKAFSQYIEENKSTTEWRNKRPIKAETDICMKASMFRKVDRLVLSDIVKLTILDLFIKAHERPHYIYLTNIHLKRGEVPIKFSDYFLYNYPDETRYILQIVINSYEMKLQHYLSKERI